MSAMTDLRSAFDAESTRQAYRRANRAPRPSIMAALGKVLGVLFGLGVRVRTEALTIGGLGFVATGFWLFSPITGCIAVGLALWALDWLLRQ